MSTEVDTKPQIDGAYITFQARRSVDEMFGQIAAEANQRFYEGLAAANKRTKLKEPKGPLAHFTRDFSF